MHKALVELLADALSLLQVQMHGADVISSWEGGRPGLPVCTSWGQAVQYLDIKQVCKVCDREWLADSTVGCQQSIGTR